MDALDFLILKCAPNSLDLVTLLHGPEHFVHARFCALATVVLGKLRRGGVFSLEFPDVSRPIRVDELFGAESWVAVEHVSGWTCDMLAEVLKAAGFARIEVNDERRYPRVTATKA